MRSTGTTFAQAPPSGPFAVWPKSGGRTRGAITVASFRHPPPRTSPTDRCDDPRRRHQPLETVAYEPHVRAKGERLIWLEERWINRLSALRRPSDSYSDVILRLVEIEASRPSRKRR